VMYAVPNLRFHRPVKMTDSFFNGAESADATVLVCLVLEMEIANLSKC
jgi:hypothetical protein